MSYHSDIDRATGRLVEHIDETIKWSRILAVSFLRYAEHEVFVQTSRLGSWLVMFANSRLNTVSGETVSTTPAPQTKNNEVKSQPRQQPERSSMREKARELDLLQIPENDVRKFVLGLIRINGLPVWQAVNYLELKRPVFDSLVRKLGSGLVVNIIDGEVIVDESVWRDWELRKGFEAQHSSQVKQIEPHTHTKPKPFGRESKPRSSVYDSEVISDEELLRRLKEDGFLSGTMI